LHIDQPLMDELRAINLQVKPHQILLVVDAMVGQDAVNSAKAFNEQLELDGIILTKFDSDTRGGAALSVKTITGKPIKFMGVGEKLEALEEFFPERIAQRMLGMGDILTLVEKAQAEFDEAKAAKLQEKMAKATFTLDDFLEQMRSVRKMGPLKNLLGLLPGIGAALKDVQIPEEELNKTEAIIQSMTRNEREDPDLIDGSRRRRVARGSGTQAEDVARLIKGFSHARDFAKKMTGLSMGSRMKMAQAMSQTDMSRMAPGGLAGMPRPNSQLPKSRLTPEQKRKLRQKRLRGK
jgi:signal recognition particle subunit SRP54